MAHPEAAPPERADRPAGADVDAALTGGNYEVLRAAARGRRARSSRGAPTRSTRGARRSSARTEPQLVATERVRTEHNCAPVDIVAVGGHLLLGFNVFLGLKAETKVADVLALHRFDAGRRRRLRHVGAAARRARRLPRRRRSSSATSRTSTATTATRGCCSWSSATRSCSRCSRPARPGATSRCCAGGSSRAAGSSYVDDRGDRDYAALSPPAYDFEWREVTRDHQVSGKHPHYNLLDTVFVECVGGDLTIKVENNTETGQRHLRRAGRRSRTSRSTTRRSSSRRSGDRVRRAGLILLKILPFRETAWRYLVFDTRSQQGRSAPTGSGRAAASLPEDHGMIFPGGYVLVGGDHKLFDGDATRLRARARAPVAERRGRALRLPPRPRRHVPAVPVQPDRQGGRGADPRATATRCSPTAAWS